MTNYEMTEKLSEKMGVTMEEAKTALEACDWDMLDAALLLEKEHGGEANAYTTRRAKEDRDAREDRGERRHMLGSLSRVVRKLIALGSRNRFEVRRKGEEAPILDMPVIVMVLLMLTAFWACVPLLVIGLFAGFHYSFSGAELGREDINHAMDKASEAADKVMDEIRKKD